MWRLEIITWDGLVMKIPRVFFLSLQYRGGTFVTAWFAGELFSISEVSYLGESSAAWYVLFVKSV